MRALMISLGGGGTMRRAHAVSMGAAAILSSSHYHTINDRGEKNIEMAQIHILDSRLKLIYNDKIKSRFCRKERCCMNHIPPMASVSELKNNHLKVLAQSEKAPVVLASRNQPVGVLVSPVHWEQFMNRLEDLEDLVDVLKTLLAEANGEIEAEEVGLEELAEWSRHGQRISA
ncbi:MAG: type II toxin-antitoxin system Phd/YefM family antitoxin [Caldilineaceae bacterium]